jgi:hypothetical protein
MQSKERYLLKMYFYLWMLIKRRLFQWKLQRGNVHDSKMLKNLVDGDGASLEKNNDDIKMILADAAHDSKENFFMICVTIIILKQLSR